MDKKKSNSTLNMPVKDRIAVFEKFRNELITSPEKVDRYLQSTGIYDKQGKLTKAYR